MNNDHEYWDPLGEKIQQDTYMLQTQKLVLQKEEYAKSPGRIKRNHDLLLLPGISIFLIYIWLFGFNRGLIYATVFGFMPLLIYRSRIHNLQENLILFLMCSENNWVYNPDDDSPRYEQFKIIYPDYFTVGHSAYIEDQIWGIMNSDKPINFWNCAFTYTTGHGRSSQTHKHSIFILRLYKSLPVSLDLKRKNILSFSGNKVKTESEEFNKLFSIDNKMTDPDGQLLLMKVLSPSVQVRLIQLATHFPVARIGFHGDSMILDFSEELWKFRYTDFFHEVKIDDRDTAYFQSLIMRMTSTPVEMLQYID